MNVIRFCVVMVLGLAAAAPAHALKAKLGVQATALGNELSGELPTEGNWTGRRAVGFSALADVHLTADIALSFQPGFTPRRSRQEFKERDEVVGFVDYEINYFCLPLLLRVTGDPVGTRGFVTAGLNLNLLLDASVDPGDGAQDISDMFRSHTLGALFGAGVMVPVGRHYLAFELRYEQGLGDIVERDGTEPEPGLAAPSVKYRGLSLSGGFLFSLGGD